MIREQSKPCVVVLSVLPTPKHERRPPSCASPGSSACSTPLSSSGSLRTSIARPSLRLPCGPGTDISAVSASPTSSAPRSAPSRTSMFLIRVTMSATCNKPPPPHPRAASTHSTLLRKGETRVRSAAPLARVTVARHPTRWIHPLRLASASAPFAESLAAAGAPHAPVCDQSGAGARTRGGLLAHSASRERFRTRPVAAAHRLRPSGRLSDCAARTERSCACVTGAIAQSPIGYDDDASPPSSPADAWFSCRTIFYVKDNGASFDEAGAGRLFAPFRRLHSDAAFPGTGIGLAAVRRVVDRHGGRVWAKGEVNRGATIYWTLPPPSATPRYRKTRPPAFRRKTRADLRAITTRKCRSGLSLAPRRRGTRSRAADRATTRGARSRPEGRSPRRT